MKVKPTANIDRIGISAVQLQFERLGYTFREQPIGDRGIDAHVEIIEDDKATGRLLALQIKSGSSWFNEQNETGFVFREDRAHLEYWLNHSLPVLVILYNLDSDVAYWQVINKETITITGKGWKLTVPHSQKLDASAKGDFRKLAGVSLTMGQYTIISLRDTSYGAAKRYTANIIVEGVTNPAAIERVIKKVTSDLKSYEYHRNDIMKQRWIGTATHIISLFIYQSIDDVRTTNWICRSEWISETLPARFAPLKLNGEDIGEGIVVDWSSNYTVMRKFYQEHTLTKGEYLQQMRNILIRTKDAIQKVMFLTKQFTGKNLSSDQYVQAMKQHEQIVTQLYMQSSNMDLAPSECEEVNRYFQNLMASAHNAVLPFSDRGLATWQDPQRSYLIRQALADYDKTLLNLELSLEKIR